MKKFITIFTTLALSISAFAQSQGSVYIGGMFGVEGGNTTTKATVGGNTTKNSTSLTTTFEVSPEVGYFVTDNIVVGGRFEYAVAGDTDVFAIGPFVGYVTPLNSVISYTPNAYCGFVSTKYDRDETVNGIGVEIRPASFEASISNGLAVNLSFINLAWVRVKNSEGEAFGADYKMVTDSYVWTLGSPSVGLKFYF